MGRMRSMNALEDSRMMIMTTADSVKNSPALPTPMVAPSKLTKKTPKL